MGEFDFGFWRRTPLVHQSEAAECGLACLSMIASRYGNYTSLYELRRRFPVSLKGITLRRLLDIADELGFATNPVRCEPEDLSQLRLPAILHWNMKHFVVLDSVSGRKVVILDPAMGRQIIGQADLDQSFTGIAVEVVPTHDFERARKIKRLSLSQILPFSPQFWRSMAQGLFLSIFLQIFILITPLFMQLVVDEVVLKAQYNLLIIVALGFASLKFFEVLALVIRNLVFQYISILITFDMKSSIYSHLMRLPMDFFLRRHIGDIQQRFASVQAVQKLVVDGFVVTIVDGLLSLILIAILFAYNVQLALISVAALLLYLAARLLLMNLSKRLSMDVLVATADENSNFLESLRAIQTIKASGIERRREARWRDLAAYTLNQQVRLGNTEILFNALNVLVLGLSNILIVFVAARQALSGEISVGMIVAFLGYKQQFEQRMMSSLDVYVQYRLLDVHLERIADVVVSQPLPTGTTPGLSTDRIDVSRSGSTA